MTKNEMRVAIAEACGWKPREHCAGFYRDYRDGWRKTLPDYPNDLNACAEFEETLSNAEILEYVQWLDRGALTKAPGRCEAFLRVKGLWKD